MKNTIKYIRFATLGWDGFRVIYNGLHYGDMIHTQDGYEFKPRELFYIPKDLLKQLSQFSYEKVRNQ